MSAGNSHQKCGIDYEGGTTVGMLRVMSRRGDDRFTWPDLKRDADFLELAQEQKRAVEEAERIFADARKNGATAFLVEAGKPSQRIDEFDPFAKEIILVPRVVGG
jgi:hypothetical protein